MRKIGKEVLFIPAEDGNPRNGEGSMIRLCDGRIMYAYTRYYGNEFKDDAIACIAAYYSSDEGESWENGGVLLEKGADDYNIMSVSLIRLNNGDLGLLYLRKFDKNGHQLCKPYLVRSSDEGKSFGEPVACIEEDGYYVGNNDRLIRLDSGRLLLPVAYHGKNADCFIAGQLMVAYSDDDGRSFKLSPAKVRSPYNDLMGLQEPGVYQLGDGRVWMWCRTAYGHQYQCFSSDGGETWSGIEPALRFTSPCSPMQVKDAGEVALAIFNPMGYNCILSGEDSAWHKSGRTPLVCAVSRDRGELFTAPYKNPANPAETKYFTRSCRYIEDSVSDSYCYPTVLAVKDGILISYYHSNGTDICLNSAKVTKIYFDEL